MRAKISLALSILCFLNLATINANAQDEINRVLQFNDTNQLTYDRNLISKLTTTKLGANTISTTYTPCTTSDLKDKCEPFSNDLSIINVIGPCLENSKVPCIENVWRSDLNGNWVRGEYKGSRMPLSKNDTIWTSDYLPGIDIPRNSNMYQFPGLPHDNGTLFEIDPVIKGISDHGSPISYSDLHIQVKAIYQTDKTDAKTRNECLGNFDPCWVASNTDVSWNIKISLQLPTAPFGWVTGRLIDTSMEVSKNSNPNLPVVFTISGRPTLTPSLIRDFRRDNSSDFEDWNKIANVFNLPWDNISKAPVLGPNSLSKFVQVIKLLPSLDKSTSEHVAWNVDLNWDKNSPQNRQLQMCATKDIIGYAGSNSLTFLDSVPSFDPKSSTIRYTVASPHFESNGSLATGQYQLQLNLGVAKCLWKISSVPLKAEINVTSADGEKKLITSTMKVSGNFLNFYVSGYGYSESTISIGLPVDEALPMPSPSTSETKSTDLKNKPEVIPNISKLPISTQVNTMTQKTITCFKGKLTKKVTGVKPACPAGYKQK